MPDLVRREVIAADDAWVWVPDDAPRVDTDEYLLVLYPTWWADSSQVLRTGSDRAPEDLVAEVLDHARNHGRADVTWWVHDLVRPPGLEEHLRSLGGAPVETLTLLARAVDRPIPPAPGEPEIRPVTDRATYLEDRRVGIEAFDEQMPPEDEIDRAVQRLAAADPDTVSLVAYVEGRPVGIGSARVVDGVARLWGGATVPAARRRGVYAAVLRARLNWALEHGARFALTRGRVDTSAPLLRRAGFGDFGEKRGYRVLV